MPDFVMSVRAVRSGAFVADTGPTRFLVVPDGGNPDPSQATTPARWYSQVRRASEWQNAQGELRGDILIVVHGYNMSETEVMDRHRRLKADLQSLGFLGIVVSFDWPSDDKALAYLPDRHHAKETAMQLVSDGITYLSAKQTPDCTINVHVLGHSTGAYVIREAFHDADDTQLPNQGWGVSQIIFAAGDVSAASMSADDSVTGSLYRHSVRVTNYSSRRDQALDLSNVKRLGTAPRVGRVGLPADAPASAINVDCTDYYSELTSANSPILGTDSPHVPPIVGMPSHSWYFGNLMFARDLLAVITGWDRKIIPTRTMDSAGAFHLQHIASTEPSPVPG